MQLLYLQRRLELLRADTRLLKTLRSLVYRFRKTVRTMIYHWQISQIAVCAQIVRFSNIRQLLINVHNFFVSLICCFAAVCLCHVLFKTQLTITDYMSYGLLLFADILIVLIAVIVLLILVITALVIYIIVYKHSTGISTVVIIKCLRTISDIHALFSAVCRCMSSSVRLSVWLSSLCLSVSNVRAPYSGGDWNFRQCFYVIWYLGHPWPFYKNFTDIIPREPIRRGVKPMRNSQI